MSDYCTYCPNTATRNVRNPHKDDTEHVCEVHYSYIKPGSADVNPMEMSRCIRCGHKSLNKRGDKERLIDHHVNYPLDITVPVCDKCHGEIHSGENQKYLERYERDTSAFEPRGTDHETGMAIHDLYANDGAMQSFSCPDCGVELLDMVDMGQKGRICPNAECDKSAVTHKDLFPV